MSAHLDSILQRDDANCSGFELDIGFDFCTVNEKGKFQIQPDHKFTNLHLGVDNCGSM